MTAVFKLPLLLGGASLILIAVSLILLVKSSQNTTPIKFSSGEATVSGITALTITVDIEGAVAQPGVYKLAPDSRVEEAIMAAGGLSGEADVELIAQTINRAARVIDGAKLYFPKIGEKRSGSSGVSGFAGISVNLASQSELEALAGVGPMTARKIIDNRPYASLEELVSKKALSRSLFEKLKNQLAI